MQKQHRRIVALLFLGSLAACSEMPQEPKEAHDPVMPGPGLTTTSTTSTTSSYLLTVDIFSDGLGRLDPEDGTYSFIGALDPATDEFESPAAMAVRPSDGTIFVWSHNREVLLTVDPATGLATTVGPDHEVVFIHALAFAPDGRLFGIRQNGTLLEIDPTTGALSTVGSTGITLFTGGADFGPDGTFYALLDTSPDRLLTIDPATGDVLTDIPLSQDVGIAGSLAFDLDGTLVGTGGGFSSPLGTVIFDIDPATGTISNIVNLSGAPAFLSGMEFFAASSNSAPSASAGGPYAAPEGSPVSFDGSGSSDPDGDDLTYSWTFGDGGSATGVAPSHAYADDGSYAVELTATDPDGASDTDATTASITNVAPSVTNLTGPTDPVAVGTNIQVTADYTDPGLADTHTAEVDWGDGTTSPGTVSGSAGSGTISATHSYGSPGVYTVSVTVADDDGGQGSATFEYAVVYDPDAGFVTGGGWIPSPAGAYAADPTLSGKAAFGFVSRYKKGATTPSGNTQFRFRAGDLTFHSTAYEWLVVAGARGQYKGTGTVNGVDGYGFMVVGIDGDAPGGGGADRFRIKIWELGSETVIYDNQAGESEDSDASTILGGGSITIHAG